MTDSTEKAEVFDAAWGTEECILFFKSSCCKVVSAARNLINSVLQAAETTFAFSSVFSLLLRYVASKLQTANPRSASSIVAYNILVYTDKSEFKTCVDFVACKGKLMIFL